MLPGGLLAGVVAGGGAGVVGHGSVTVTSVGFGPQTVHFVTVVVKPGGM